jgi:hypothetical protein
MLNSIRFVASKGARGASAAVIVLCALLAGCAGGVSNTAQYSAQPQVRPDNIYVYSFDSTPNQVKLDNGGVIQKMTSQFDGTSTAQKQAQEAAEVREQVANEIVRQLQSMGLRAIRSDVPAPADQNVLLVQGKFDTIDSGNRRRRILIGLGAGKSELSTSVQLLYKPAGGAPRLVQSFDASADSGKMPGIAETAGVGAAAGHLATSAYRRPGTAVQRAMPRSWRNPSPNKWRRSANRKAGCPPSAPRDSLSGRRPGSAWASTHPNNTTLIFPPRARILARCLHRGVYSSYCVEQPQQRLHLSWLFLCHSRSLTLDRNVRNPSHATTSSPSLRRACSCR